MPTYKYKDLEHGSTVVVAANQPELAYIIAWCNTKNKSVSCFIRSVIEFPFCLSVYGTTAGWTNQMDRGLYYMPFSEFIEKANNK